MQGKVYIPYSKPCNHSGQDIDTSRHKFKIGDYLMTSLCSVTRLRLYHIQSNLRFVTLMDLQVKRSFIHYVSCFLFLNLEPLHVTCRQPYLNHASYQVLVMSLLHQMMNIYAS